MKKEQNRNNSHFYSTNSPLKIIPIGGTTTVQKNLYVYEWGNDIVVLDCGLGFPDIDTPGIDIIIPDFTYILENKSKVKGIVITHGHEDHRGSLPYLLRSHKFPVYAVPFVKSLIEKTLEEYTDLSDIRINPIDINQSFQLGVFRVHPFRVNHSIPDTLGFAIDTPQGRILHNSDFKFDTDPYMDPPFDVSKAVKLASEKPEGVLALLSDCLGATTDGHSESEQKIQTEFESILSKSEGKQVLITTISSNISRIKMAIEASLKMGRKIVISGRSLRNTLAVAKEFRYIDYPEEIFVKEEDSYSYDQGKLTYIITGCYGQRNSGLFRVSEGTHKQITLLNEAVVIFSADPIPNSISMVNYMIEELYIKGAEVYYSEIQDNLHVSGHGIKEDLLELANIVRPKYFIPIGGNIKHMRAYAKLMGTIGIPENRVFQLLDGQPIVFENGIARLGKKLKLKEVYVDGNLVGDIGSIVLEDRLRMANHGMVVAAVSGDKIDIVTRGFVFAKESQELLNGAKKIIRENIKEKKTNKKSKEKTSELKKHLERKLDRYFYKETGREPIILVSIL